MSKSVAPIVVLPKDYFKVFPHLRSVSGVYRRYQAMKKALAKEDHQFITVEEMAKYEGIPVETIQRCLLT